MDLDDLLDEALDELGEEDERRETSGLAAAAARVATESDESQKTTREAATGDGALDMQALFAELENPEFLKSLEDAFSQLAGADGDGELGELLKSLGGPPGEGGEEFSDEQLAKMLKALAPGEGGDAANYEERLPLSRVPPLNGTVELTWYADFGLWLGSALRWAGAQTRLALADVADTRIPDGGTPGFAVWDLRAGYRLDPHLLVGLVLENVILLKDEQPGAGEIDEAAYLAEFALD